MQIGVASCGCVCDKRVLQVMRLFRWSVGAWGGGLLQLGFQVRDSLRACTSLVESPTSSPGHTQIGRFQSVWLARGQHASFFSFLPRVRLSLGAAPDLPASTRREKTLPISGFGGGHALGLGSFSRRIANRVFFVLNPK